MLIAHRALPFLAVVAGAAVLVVGGSAVAGVVAGDPPVTVTSSLGATPVVGAVQPEQAAAFRVLRRPRRTGDAMPADVAAAMAGPGRFGRNAALARAVRTAEGPGWVVPGRDAVCLVIPEPGVGHTTTCRPTKAATKEGVTLQLVAARASSSVTLVPDGGRVVVSGKGATRSTVRPDASGVVAVDTTGASRLTVVTARGRWTAPVPAFGGRGLPKG